jgi:CRP/FNR family transcriptional regulator, cyclic AMP receptor protein
MSLPTENDLLANRESHDTCSCELLDDLEVLRRSAVFRVAPIEVIKLLALFSKRITFKAGDLIVRQGEPADRAFLILRGEVEVFEDYKNRQFNLQALGKMGFFGELSLLATFDWFFSVQARNEVELITINRESFQKIGAKFPDHLYMLTERIVQLRIKRMENQMHFLLDNIRDDALRGNGSTSPQTMIA